MPSVKPDKAEISALRYKRELFNQGDNLFSDICLQCRNALDGGYITQRRALKLLSYLSADLNMRSIFPNNYLFEMLKKFCKEGVWLSDNEGVLLDFIATFYLGYSLDDQSVVGVEIGISSDMNAYSKQLTVKEHPEMIRPPDILFPLQKMVSAESNSEDNISSYIYDSPSEDIDLDDKFVSFTGAFDGFTRKECFQETRKLGGVPADPAYFLDYLFVANKSIEEHAVSNQLSESIDLRRKLGNPLILGEDDWRKVIQRN